MDQLVDQDKVIFGSVMNQILLAFLKGCKSVSSHSRKPMHCYSVNFLFLNRMPIDLYSIMKNSLVWLFRTIPSKLYP